MLRVAKGIRRVAQYDEPAYMELVRQPEDLNGYRDFFRSLELMDVNLLADCQRISLVCFGATMSTTVRGATVANGRFQLLGEFDSEVPDVKINLRATLVISQRRDTHVSVSPSGTVGYFKAPCRITMDPDDFNQHWASFARVDNPLFGFFNASEKDVKSEASVESSLSKLGRTFTRQFSSKTQHS
jgi:hypothetical protein